MVDKRVINHINVRSQKLLVEVSVASNDVSDEVASVVVVDVTSTDLVVPVLVVAGLVDVDGNDVSVLVVDRVRDDDISVST